MKLPYNVKRVHTFKCKHYYFALIIFSLLKTIFSVLNFFACCVAYFFFMDFLCSFIEVANGNQVKYLIKNGIV